MILAWCCIVFPIPELEMLPYVKEEKFSYWPAVWWRQAEIIWSWLFLKWRCWEKDIERTKIACRAKNRMDQDWQVAQYVKKRFDTWRYLIWTGLEHHSTLEAKAFSNTLAKVLHKNSVTFSLLRSAAEKTGNPPRRGGTECSFAAEEI